MLADSNSSHTFKWVQALSEKGVEICLFGLSAPKLDYSDMKGVQVHSGDLSVKRTIGALSKAKYLKSVPYLKKLLREFQPDIVHAHFATSYGLLASRLKHPVLFISVWGTDVYRFPKQSILHRSIFKHILKKANFLLSTSKDMARELALYTNQHIQILPFGVDTKKFCPSESKQRETITIGCIKWIEENYGIQYLFQAFAKLKNEAFYPQLKLLIVGDGSYLNELKRLCQQLAIEGQVSFAGRVDHSQVVEYHQQMDIEVYLSHFESFGVSAVEAAACGNPLIVSRVGGLPEVVEDGNTGFIVASKDVDQLKQKLEVLINDSALRSQLGQAGRTKVLQEYSWEQNVEQMLDIYRRALS